MRQTRCSAAALGCGVPPPGARQHEFLQTPVQHLSPFEQSPFPQHPTQVPLPQSIFPEGHSQLPSLQTIPPLHALPHPPQWLALVLVSTQAVPHKVSAPGQVG